MGFQKLVPREGNMVEELWRDSLTSSQKWQVLKEYHEDISKIKRESKKKKRKCEGIEKGLSKDTTYN